MVVCWVGHSLAVAPWNNIHPPSEWRHRAGLTRTHSQLNSSSWRRQTFDMSNRGLAGNCATGPSNTGEAMLGDAARHINHSRMVRIWRREGPQVPQKKKQIGWFSQARSIEESGAGLGPDHPMKSNHSTLSFDARLWSWSPPRRPTWLSSESNCPPGNVAATSPGLG